MERAARFIMLVAVFAAATLGLAAPASAGGWAVTSLDAMPAPAPGEEVTVGFTILQHGATPVSVDDVRIEIVSPSGGSRTFAAVPDGPVGHYVATVVFEEAGNASWKVHQGWFGEQDLGTINVGAAPAATSGGGYGSPPVIRYGLPVLAVLLAAFVVGDALRARRRSHPSAIAA